MSAFEKFLREHKDELDNPEANPEIWLKIENGILRSKFRKNRRIIWFLASAAAILGLMIVPTVIFDKTSTVSPEDIVAHYGLQDLPGQVSSMTHEISQSLLPAEHSDDFGILIKQLEFLDKQYLDILKYVEENGYQEYIGKQLTDYYETKIELLNKIQSEIQKINKYENATGESRNLQRLIY